MVVVVSPTTLPEPPAFDAAFPAAPPSASDTGNGGGQPVNWAAEAHRAIRAGELVLLDLWGKLAEPGAVYADITWMGFTGRQAPEREQRAFEAVAAARDAAISLVQRAVAAGQELRGWQVDRATRDVIEAAGYGEAFCHRTGHSIGQEVHGNGANIDEVQSRVEIRGHLVIEKIRDDLARRRRLHVALANRRRGIHDYHRDSATRAV